METTRIQDRSHLEKREEIEGLVEIFPPESLRLEEGLILDVGQVAVTEVLQAQDSRHARELHSSQEVLVANNPPGQGSTLSIVT